MTAKLKHEDPDFLELAFSRFKLCEEAESESRLASLEDFEFYKGNQWPDWILKERVGRPSLTNNRLPQFVKQVTNEQRQQRPAIQVNPVGDGADVDTAEILQGVVRHVEVISEAETVYDMSFEHMVIGGFAYWRLLLDYVSDDSNEQEIYIVGINNPFSVYLDPNCKKLNKSDSKFGFIFEDMTVEEYRAQYKDSELAGLDDFKGLGNSCPGWLQKDSIRVAEYFYIETEKKTVNIDGREREISKPTVKWAKINAVEKLDSRDWIGKWVPIIALTGDELQIDGKLHRAGLVRNAKDPQRQYNFMQSAATEAIALAPRAPWVAVAGATEKYPEWATANTQNHSLLRYDPVDVQGKPTPEPKRNSVEPPIQAMAVMIRQADNDLKATTGIYDASLGEKGPDQSGKSILARQKQSDVANLNYSDNLKRSIAFTGQQILDLIPKVYEKRTLQRIVKPDGTVDTVNIKNSYGVAQ